MNCENNELSVQLHEAFVVETCLIDRLRETFAIPDASWVDEPVERVKRSEAISKLMQDLKQAQNQTEQLIAAWRQSDLEMPKFLFAASKAKRAALTAALDALQLAQQEAEKSKGAALSLLAKTNQMQEILGAYTRR